MADLKKKTTIYDVAQAADVTIATVSRVINGKDNVAEATRRKVMEAIESLNYYPSPIASGLSRQRSREIGVLVPFFFGEFFLKILEGSAQDLADHDLILYNAATPDMKKQIINKVVGENKLDGLFIISLPVLLDEEIQLQKAKFPIVLLDNFHKEYSSVSLDNVFGAFKATEHLIDLGHRDIAIMTGAAEDPFHLTVAKDRLKGYKMALNMAEIPMNEKFIAVNDWSREGAYFLTKKLLSMKQHPTAIFSVSDLQAVGIMAAVRDMGLHVPQDVSVIGYDNMDFSDYIGLTTIAQPLHIVSRLGSNVMREQIESGITKKESVVLQPSLVIRETTAPPPASD